jgi:hypothetical protein
MKTFLIRIVFRTLCLGMFLATLAAAQEVIPLYPATPPGSTPESSTPESYPEKEYFSKLWNTEVVANVTKPSLTVFKPSPELRNGTALVICPGGGFMALSITSEGNDVAKYMAARGVTAFVLKYRIAHTSEDATQEFAAMLADMPKYHVLLAKFVPLAVADGLAAVTYVRQHASEWGVSPDRVGIIGFSAGGAITAGVAFHYAPEGRPAFVAPIYAGGKSSKMPPFQQTRHPCLLPRPRMISLDSCRKASPCISGGPQLTNRPNCTSMPGAATASEWVNTTFLRIIGLTGSPIGWSWKGG